nr:MAG TPA: ENOD40 protein [Caudoviricetes sp.]
MHFAQITMEDRSVDGSLQFLNMRFCFQISIM